MQIKIIFCLVFLFLCGFPVCNGQDYNYEMTVGLQIKPIFPSALFNTGKIDVSQNNVRFQVELTPKVSFSGGMSIRATFTERYAFETGINITRRDYDIILTQGGLSIPDGFAIIGYEIPLLGLVYVQLAEKIFMNAAFGGSLDFYPSSLRTEEPFFQHYTRIKSWVIPSLLANLGAEYRTEGNGYYYIGASYHRPFTEIANTKIQYIRPGPGYSETINAKLSGTYLTIDFRYYFAPKNKFN